MHQQIAEDEKFNNLNATAFAALPFGTYENCEFTACNFTGIKLDNITFIDCRFRDCDLNNISVFKTGLQNISFNNCQLQGVNFSKALDFLFGINGTGSDFTGCIFYQKKNKAAVFTDCNLAEVDFTESDFTNAKFDGCNFNRAQFSYTMLKGADMRTSYNFIIDPDENTLKKTRFSVQGLPGLLAKHDLRIE